MRASQIPVFRLFGETGDFPDVIHHERIRDRALLHDWEIGTHRHSELVQLFHMEKGSAKVRIDDRDFTLKDGEILYIPAQAVHGFSFRQGAEGGVFSFPLTLIFDLPAAGEDLALRLSRPEKIQADPVLLSLLATLVEVFHKAGTFRASLLVGIGKAVLIALAEAAAREDAEGEPSVKRRMGDFDRALRQNLNATLSAADYAQNLGITAGHLNRICRAATGTSASIYIETARMTEASRLLAFTQLAIAEVGYRLGYDDPSYFSRRFRHITGQSPSAYRQRFLD